MIRESGIAERKVTNTWVVDPSEKQLEHLRGVLTPAQYSLYISEEVVVKCPDEKARELRDKLGAKYEYYFVPSTKRTVTAAGRSALGSDRGLMRAVGKAVTVVQSVKVTIKPVERDKPVEREA